LYQFNGNTATLLHPTPKGVGFRALFSVIDLFAQTKQLLWQTFKKAGSWQKARACFYAFHA